MAPKGAVFTCNFTAVETVKRCLPATARMLGLLIPVAPEQGELIKWLGMYSYRVQHISL